MDNEVAFLKRVEPDEMGIVYRILMANSQNSTVPVEGMTVAGFKDVFEDSMYFWWRTPREILAVVNLGPIDALARKAEFGVVSLVRRAGNATAAWQALCALAFRSMGLHRLYCIVNADNEPCLDLIRKRRLRREGTLKHNRFKDGKFIDQHIYGVLEFDRAIWDAAFTAPQPKEQEEVA